MTVYLPRDAWTNTPRPGLTPLIESRVRGVAVHHPGTTSRQPFNTIQTSIASRLEGYRRYHVSGHGWTDIAYGTGIDQTGRVWDLRGFQYQSAANGDTDVNQEWAAVLFLLAEGEAPSPALIEAFQDWRRTHLLERFPGATRVVGHRDVRPAGTSCPGDETYALIRNDTLTREERHDMDTTAEDMRKFWRGTAAAEALGVQDPTAKPGTDDPVSPGEALARILRDSADAKAMARDALGAADAARAAAVATQKAVASSAGGRLTAEERKELAADIAPLVAAIAVRGVLDGLSARLKD